MTYSNLIFELNGAVATMTLNRPDSMNAYTNELGDEFLNVLERVRVDEMIRVLVITGAGRGFCSGVDIEEAKEAAARRQRGITDWHDHLIAWITTAPKRMMELGKPIVAAVNGAAIGMGLSIALACDIRIASDKAKFAASFGRVALVPEFGSTVTLPHVLGLGKALELVLTNKVIGADEAKGIGLVTDVVAPEKLLDSANELGLSLSKGSALAIRLAKYGLYQGLGANIEAQLAWEGKALKECFVSKDHAEGLRAFIEKRQPSF